MDTTPVRPLVAARIRDCAALMTELLNDSAYLLLVDRAAASMATALSSGHKVLLFGNGGSAADAQHLAAELSGRFLRERRSLAALALTTNSSSLTAISNDYSFDEVFARQLEGLGNAGDVALGISTSGRSTNVLRAMQTARQKELITIGLTGRTGGELRQLADHCICIPSDQTPRIQEAHILTGHILCELVETQLFPEGRDRQRAGARAGVAD